MANYYIIPSYGPAEIQDEHPSLWATINKYFPDLKDERKAIIGALVINTCPNCHDADARCKCWNEKTF